MSGEVLSALSGFTTDTEKAREITALWLELDSLKAGAITGWREIESYRYATSTHNLQDSESAFNHSTHIPVVASIAEDLEAILSQVVIPHEDWFVFEPQTLDAALEKTAVAVKAYLKNRFSLNGQVSTIRKLITSLVTYGICFSQVSHVDERNERKVGYVGAKTRIISPFDIVFNPTAPDFNEANKIVRELVSVGELVRRARNRTFDEGVVEKLLAARLEFSGEKKRGGSDKNEKYVPLGFGSYEDYVQSGQVELLWFYGDVYDQHTNTLIENRVIVVMDDEHVVLDEEIDTPNGRPYIFRSAWKELPDSLWGQSPLANIIGLNYQINHRENAKSEGLDRLIYPDKVFIGDIEEIYDEEEQRTTYINAEGGGGVQEIPIDTQFLGFNLEIDKLEQRSRSAARLPSDLTGFRSQGEKTALEFSALTDGGMRGFIDKASDFERSTLEPILQASLELAHRHFGEVLQVPTKVEGGFLEMLDISQEQLAVDGLLIPKGARRFARKNQMMSTLTQLSSSNLMQLVAAHISGKKLAHLVEDLLEVNDTGVFDEFAAIVEQGEAMKMQQTVEQDIAAQASEPSVQEGIIQQDLQNLGGQDG